ncbi:MAG: protoheme IX farnesyltransferase [Rhodospirillales bacterium]|nr:protoheme IX farnesyltransferase [Rhodospirillales bacterium]
MTTLARELYSVFKIRIGIAIALAALAGMAVSPGPAPEPWQIAVLGLSVLASAASAGAFNQLFEYRFDALMKRTSDRPFVTGRFRVGPVWYAGVILLLATAVGTAAYALNNMVAFYVFLGAFVYGVVYTVWLKRRSVWNIVIGGLSGSFAVLAGAASVGADMSAPALLLAVVLFLWTPPHFWSLAAALRDDYAQAGIPMLPVVVGEKTAARIILINTILLVSASMLPTAFGLGWFYWGGAAIGGSYFLYRSLKYSLDPSPANAMKNFFASLVQLVLLIAGALVGAFVGL